MNIDNLCPCCSEPMLRHTRHGGSIYWFCPHCWQEMPNLLSEVAERQANRSLEYLVK